jgi:predicted MFS family arabinose efflux permease
MSRVGGKHPRTQRGVSAWAPLGQPIFRMLWLAVLASDIGIWMQTVGAQWLLVDLPNAATLVALVQTADTLPDVLLALPGGALADAFDRRRLLIGLQTFQVVVGIGLTALTLAGQMTTPLLLAFTFTLGAASALATPAYQALIPDLVPRNQLSSATALGGVSVNLARAVGPAVAGLLIARVGVGAVFALNTATFAVFALVLLGWRRPPGEDRPLPERFIPALRAGGRYVRYSPVVRRILLHLSLFLVPASALWALLPLVATRRLGLGPGGYGLLLGALGAGAIMGALALPWLRERVSSKLMLPSAAGVYGTAMVVLVLVREPLTAFAALLPAGAAWIVVIATSNTTLQLFLPRWVRARGLAAFQMVLFGSQAAGALLWGLIAGQGGLVLTFLIAAGALLAGTAAGRIRPLFNVSGLDRDPSVPWAEPELLIDPAPEAGPVLVTVTYTVAAEREQRFLRAMRSVRLSRLRTGAIWWELYRDGERENRLVEAYAVLSWDEHLRQHHGRLTGADADIEHRAIALANSPPQVSHLFPVEAS